MLPRSSGYRKKRMLCFSGKSDVNRRR